MINNYASDTFKKIKEKSPLIQQTMNNIDVKLIDKVLVKHKTVEQKMT